MIKAIKEQMKSERTGEENDFISILETQDDIAGENQKSSRVLKIQIISYNFTCQNFKNIY